MRITVEELRQLWRFLRCEAADVIAYNRRATDEADALKKENADLRAHVDNLKSQLGESDRLPPKDGA